MWFTVLFFAFLGMWKVLSFVADAADIPIAATIGKVCAVGLVIGALVFPTPFRTATIEFVDQEAKPFIERIQHSLRDLLPTPTTTEVGP